MVQVQTRDARGLGAGRARRGQAASLFSCEKGLDILLAGLRGFVVSVAGVVIVVIVAGTGGRGGGGEDSRSRIGRKAVKWPELVSLN